MTKKRNIMIIIAIAVALCFYHLLDKDDFLISNIEWQCGGNLCNVSFNIANRSNNQIQCNVSIRAHSQRRIGKGAVVNDIVGEKKVLLNIEPSEQRQITETLNLTGIGRVDRVAVRAWNNK